MPKSDFQAFYFPPSASKLPSSALPFSLLQDRFAAGDHHGVDDATVLAQDGELWCEGHLENDAVESSKPLCA